MPSWPALAIFKKKVHKKLKNPGTLFCALFVATKKPD